MGLVEARQARRQGAAALQRLALFLCALHRERAEALLEGLAPGPRRQARAFTAEVLRWESPRRQARLATEFGPPDRPEERLEALLQGAPPALRAALREAAPGPLRARLASGASAAPPAAPALRALAARLVAEALERG